VGASESGRVREREREREVVLMGTRMQDQFSWDQVKADKHRENYLGTQVAVTTEMKKNRRR
jgi:hypothetical protein